MTNREEADDRLSFDPGQMHDLRPDAERLIGWVIDGFMDENIDMARNFETTWHDAIDSVVMPGDYHSRLNLLARIEADKPQRVLASLKRSMGQLLFGETTEAEAREFFKLAAQYFHRTPEVLAQVALKRAAESKRAAGEMSVIDERGEVDEDAVDVQQAGYFTGALFGVIAEYARVLGYLPPDEASAAVEPSSEEEDNR